MFINVFKLSAMYTIAEENYIKGIYHLGQFKKTVSTNALAGRLQTKAASVTDMLKKLQAKQILNYEPYYGVSLTKLGHQIALGIIRRHRLWEYFLVNRLQFGWDEVHEIAEQLEHIQSEKLTEKLDQYLNFPRFDPHGDPIPDKKGKMFIQNQISLKDLPANQETEICAVNSQSPELLEMLHQKNLRIGVRLEIIRRFGFDGSLEISIEGQPSFNISHQLAGHLMVKV